MSEGDVDGLTALLDAGVPAACVSDEGSTALIVAAEGGASASRCSSRGCPINHQNAEGLTALMQGVKYEDISIVQAIFEAGARSSRRTPTTTRRSISRASADPEICNLLTGENKVEGVRRRRWTTATCAATRFRAEHRGVHRDVRAEELARERRGRIIIL